MGERGYRIAISIKFFMYHLKTQNYSSIGVGIDSYIFRDIIAGRILILTYFRFLTIKYFKEREV
jgi:hypothetical protein